jgi:hypothetical protein
VRRGKISHRVAESRSSTPEELKRLLGGEPPAPVTAPQQRVSIGAPNGGGAPGNGNGTIALGGPGRGI